MFKMMTIIVRETHQSSTERQTNFRGMQLEELVIKRPLNFCHVFLDKKK